MAVMAGRYNKTSATVGMADQEHRWADLHCDIAWSSEDRDLGMSALVIFVFWLLPLWLLMCFLFLRQGP